LKQKIQHLETELELSKNETLESERKLQLLAEELRARILEEKVRSQKLARRNSRLAAERANTVHQLHAFEEVLNKAHSRTFEGKMEPLDDAPTSDISMTQEEATQRELLLLRRLGVIGNKDTSQNAEAHLRDCPTM